MIKFLKNFRQDAKGAASIDWIVLTAAVTGLAVAAYSSIQTGATGLPAGNGAYLETQIVE